jgi:hypothetical protein
MNAEHDVGLLPMLSDAGALGFARTSQASGDAEAPPHSGPFVLGQVQALFAKSGDVARCDVCLASVFENLSRLGEPFFCKFMRRRDESTHAVVCK